MKLTVHLRPAGAIVRLARRFAAEIFLEKQESIVLDGKVVAVKQDGCMKADAKDLMALMAFELSEGTRVRICAQGTDAQEAVDELAKLFDSKFSVD